MVKLDPESAAPNLPARKSSLGHNHPPPPPLPLAQKPEPLQQQQQQQQNVIVTPPGYIATNTNFVGSGGGVIGGGNGGIIVPPNESQLAASQLPLSKCEWYFPDADRETVREKLKGARDGTFLVRPSTSGNGEYTLTLKKDGTDRVIKVYNNNGRYGFTKGSFCLDFLSVPELVNYYRHTSLKDYNKILDIKLLYPLSRFAHQDTECLDDDIDKVVQKYLEVRKKLGGREKDFEENHVKYKKIEHDLDIKRQAFEAFHEAEQLFDEQLSTQKRYQAEAQPHEVARLKDNMELLKNRLSQLVQCKTELSKSYEAQKASFLQLERNMQSLKPILNKLRKEEEGLIK